MCLYLCTFPHFCRPFSHPIFSPSAKKKKAPYLLIYYLTDAKQLTMLATMVRVLVMSFLFLSAVTDDDGAKANLIN